jgi:hypothetical protein
MHLIRKTELCRLANGLVIRPADWRTLYSQQIGGREPRYSGAVELLRVRVGRKRCHRWKTRRGAFTGPHNREANSMNKRTSRLFGGT